MLTILDNFLPKTSFEKLQEILTSVHFTWFWSDKIVGEMEAICEETYNCQLFHMFSVDGQYRWDCDKECIKDLLQKLTEYELVNDMTNIFTKIHILRAKANLNTRTFQHMRSGFHTDSSFPCKTAIFYINSNNGFTEFENGTTVESVENRIVVFDSRIKHTGVSCTNEKRRIVLNINYSLI